jgi:HlyD family secretion protein
LRRALIFTILALGLAGVIGFLVWRPTGGSAADAPYRLAAIDRGPITASVRATGSLSPVTTVLVGSQMSGQVVEILADYNSPVKAGQVVARLYSEQIKARRDAARADLEQARADVAMRRAQIDRARATKQRAEANLQDMQAQRERTGAQLTEGRRNLERQNELFDRRVGTQAGLETARTQVDVQRAALASSEAQIASARAELKGLDADIALAEAQLKSSEAVVLQREAKLKDIEIDLDRTDIRSPVDGVVVQRQIDLGQTVAASLQAPTLFTVAQDLREIDIYANIDEADVGRMKAGQPVSFTVNAYPSRTFTGAVRLVRLGAQTIQNVVTYTAVIRVDNRDMALLPGMTANLQIVTEERRNPLRAPNAALRFRPAGASAAIAAAPVAAGEREGPRRTGGRAFQDMRERISAEVQPTPEQAAAIARILTEARSGFPGRDPSLSGDERRAAMRQTRDDTQQKIAAALDPERRAKYEAIVADLRPGNAASTDGGMPGRVYVLGTDGAPVAIALRLGVTDGSNTEILAGEIKEGDAVIIGGGPRSEAAAGAPAAPTSRPRTPRLF